MYEIIAGRTEEERKEHALKASFLIGKHYVTMGQGTSLANKVYIDANRSHVVFVVGKRGSGKSYTMGAMIESLQDMSPEIKNKISIVVLDTMGIFWTTKHENTEDSSLLREWSLRATSIPLHLFVPLGHYERYIEEGIPVDKPFSFKPYELSVNDWCTTFSVSMLSEEGIFINKIISALSKELATYTLSDVLHSISQEQKIASRVKAAVESLFLTAQQWGLFSDQGISISELTKPGTISVLDVSGYAAQEGSTSIRALVIGLLSRQIFSQRMIARKKEEYATLHHESGSIQDDASLIWLFVDEAHEFLPKEGKTLATQPLLTLLREGRQPGISLVLASQQPAQIHTDVITQSDIVIAHRLTAKIDVDALGLLMQSYMRKNLDKELMLLPKVAGSALLFDDINEKIYPIQVKPRVSWHGGSSPTAIKKNSFESLLDF